MLIPALVAANLLALAWWLRRKEWIIFSAGVRWAGIILLVGVMIWLAVFVVVWLVQLVRVAIGRDNPAD